MKRIVSKLSLVSIPILALALAGPAAAQASRTWVSGVGDDVNPCSRTAPCKTWAGAISKTAAGGEISVLDPGGFGAVTITKSISLNNVYSGEGGITAAGTSGIIVNAGANDIINISGLYIEGLTTGLNGISILSAAQVNVQNTTIKDFRNNNVGLGAGINAQPSVNPVVVNITDCVINANGNTTGGGAGVLVKPTGTGRVYAVIDNTTLNGNVVGVKADASNAGQITKVVVRRSTISGSLTQGLTAITQITGGQTVNMMLDEVVSANNSGPGTRSDGANAAVTIGRSTLVNNGGPGMSSQNSGVFNTFKNNQLSGNSGTEATPVVIPLS